jgi:ribosomal protein L40E
LLYVGVLAAVIVIGIISKWWVDGLVSGVEFFALSVIYGGLAFGLFAVASAGKLVPTILVLILLVGSVGWVLYCNQKQGLRQYYKEKIRNYERVIMADPRNTAARGQLAECYYMIGDLDSAIAAMELAVHSSYNAMKERHKLRQWHEEREMRDSKTIVCSYCHSRNLWGTQPCRTCRTPIVYPPHGKGQGRRNFGYLAAGTLLAALSVVSFVTMEPQGAAIVVGCVTLTMVGWMLLASSKGRPVKR